MAVGWSTRVAEGDWLGDRIRGLGKNVGSVVPHGYGAYARIFHLIVGGPATRWSELAARHGRVAHAEMQFHLISRRVGDAPSGYAPLREMSVGSLPRAECEVLSEVLAGHTATPESCWFAVWEGWGQLQGSPAVSGLARGGGATVAALVPEDVLRAGRVRLPGRSFVLLHGAVTDVVEVFDRLWGQSPNLWWPADRAWCVATEIDFGWSYFAGSVAAVAEVIARPELEALETDVDHGVQYTSDRINADLA